MPEDREAGCEETQGVYQALMAGDTRIQLKYKFEGSVYKVCPY